MNYTNKIRLGTELLLVVVLSTILGLIASRSNLGNEIEGYRYVCHAKAFCRGYDWRSIETWVPPGYHFLLAVLLTLNIDPLIAEAILSILSFAGSAILVFLLFKKHCSHKLIWPYLLIFILNENYLKKASTGWPEGPFVFFVILAIYAFDYLTLSLPLQKASSKQQWLRRIVLQFFAAIALILPFYIRYIGLVFSVTLCAGLILPYLFRKDWSASLKAFLVSMVVIFSAAPLFIRNYLLAKTLTGFPPLIQGARPAYTFFSALEAIIYETGIFSSANIFSLGDKNILYFIDTAFKARGLIVVFTIFILFILCIFSGKAITRRIVAFCSIAYILGFSFCESIKCIDLIFFHYIFPVIPLINLAVIFTFDFLSSQLKAKYASRKLWFVLKVCVLFLVALYFTRAAYVLIKGDSPEKRSYSPITINYMRNIPFTSNHKIVIAGNAECNQIGLYLDGYDVYTIPAEDPENGGLNAAYGIYPWTKEQALDYFRKHNISYLVFCFGNGKENFINDSVSKYGPYIHRLIEQKEPIVKHKIELTDGIILELSPDLR